MRDILLVLALAASTAYAQQQRKPERAVVHVQVDDCVKLKAEALLKEKKYKELRGLKLQQPYTYIVTGFAVSPDGEIVTPALHPRATLRILVTFHDGRVAEATVVGTDPRTNIALVRVPTRTHDYLELNEEAPETNRPIDICGHCPRAKKTEPARLPGYIAREQVSVNLQDMYGVTRQRTIRMGSVFAVFTSGGTLYPGSPCLDTAGRVLGLLIGGMPALQVPDQERPGQTATVHPHFIVPAQRIARVVNQLREHGRCIRAHYGVKIVPVPPALRAHFDLPKSASTVVRVDPHSPASAAGLHPNDVILKFDGKNYADTNQLGEAMSDHPPGQPVAFEVLRNGHRKTLQAVPTDK